MIDGKQIKANTVTTAQCDASIEETVNKSIATNMGGSVAAASDTLYPSQKAVRSYAPSRGISWVMANNLYNFY